MYPVDARNDSMDVHLSQIPGGWRVATPLTSTSEDSFTAETYDRLVDSPVEIGAFKEGDFDEGGGHYRVVVDAEPGDYEMEKVTATLRRIVQAATIWMSDRPFDSYMFIYHFPRGPGGGGMEHAYSTAIALNADVLAKSPETLSSVTAHEFFHLWNVKRIRPRTMEPVDYTKENYTRALWFSEGCTSSAADFIQLRAGLIGRGTFRTRARLGDWRARAASGAPDTVCPRNPAWMRGWRATCITVVPSAAFRTTTKASCSGSSWTWPCVKPAMVRRACASVSAG